MFLTARVSESVNIKESGLFLVVTETAASSHQIRQRCEHFGQTMKQVADLKICHISRSKKRNDEEEVEI